ncbi:hypothetical protein GCK32_011988 [Trichostrongylus colubriformis]|uniref:V-SNARE coiled-coil homology domain-containing protein n=1 Tax=Trichostrongylus colubriformis TaxID=6319 RepID=A0AAN8EW06_TRICO
MKVNVEKVLERDQKLSQLDDRADALQEGASQFEKSAATLKRKYWWKNIKMMIIMEIASIFAMPVDQTPYFKAHVKTLTNQGVVSVGKNDVEKQEHPSVSLAYKKLAAHAFSLGKDLAEFRQVVLSRRSDYLSFNSPTRMMDESERDEFDRDTEKALSQLSLAIRRFSSQTSGNLLTAKEEKKHLSLVADLLSTQLKQIARLVTDMSFSNYVHISCSPPNKRKRKSLARWHPHYISPRDDVQKEFHSGVSRQVKAKSEDVPQDGWELEAAVPILEPQHNEDDVDSRLSPQERMQLMAENERIYDRFSHMHAQIEGLETQITEIQRLQETFAEKIMDQEKDIEIINEAALHTSENLKDGNEWIRQAISNSAGRRVVVLFCIIVITFSLLFLDWYNP